MENNAQDHPLQNNEGRQERENQPGLPDEITKKERLAKNESRKKYSVIPRHFAKKSSLGGGIRNQVRSRERAADVEQPVPLIVAFERLLCNVREVAHSDTTNENAQRCAAEGSRPQSRTQSAHSLQQKSSAWLIASFRQSATEDKR